MAIEISLDGIRILDIETMQPVDVHALVKKRVKYLVEVIGKAGYPHYTLKEIFEIPEAMVRTTYSLMERYL